MRFSELERNGFFLLKEKGPSAITQSLGMTDLFELTIMAQRKFPPVRVKLF
jgi:hypothetical protein